MTANNTDQARAATLARKIKGSLNKSAEQFILVGKLLTEARAKGGPCHELRRPDWEAWLKDGCGISRTDAVRLMKIAKNEYLADGANLHHLPKTASALYKLSSKTPDELKEMAEKGELFPGMTAAKAGKKAPGGTIGFQLDADDPLCPLLKLISGNLTDAADLTDEEKRNLFTKLGKLLLTTEQDREIAREALFDSSTQTA
jgi:hypothetical protein